MHSHSKISGIYAITPEGDIDFNHIKVLLQSRIRILQYRSKNRAWADKQRCAQTLKQLCHHHQTLFIINDDVALAHETDADGVHLGVNDASLTHARSRLGADKIIGISCYNNIARAIDAEQNGANYVAFGSIFPSSTKPNAPRCELDIITQAKQILTIPIVAIGGITATNKQRVFNAGADAVAMIAGLDALIKE